MRMDDWQLGQTTGCAVRSGGTRNSSLSDMENPPSVFLPRRADARTALDPFVAVHGRISLLGNHLAGSGRLARASALLLMHLNYVVR